MMKKILGAVFGSLLLVGLNSCVSNPEATQAQYDNYSEQDLCMGYLYYDWMNIYQQYRANAIKKRGIDCRPYVEMAAYKYKRDRAAWDTMYRAVDSLGTSRRTTQSSSSTGTRSIGFTKVCYYEGTGGQSALTVLSTSICPLSHSHNVAGFTKVCNYPNAMGGPKAITYPSLSICPMSYPN